MSCLCSGKRTTQILLALSHILSHKPTYIKTQERNTEFIGNGFGYKTFSTSWHTNYQSTLGKRYLAFLALRKIKMPEHLSFLPKVFLQDIESADLIKTHIRINNLYYT